MSDAMSRPGNLLQRDPIPGAGLGCGGIRGTALKLAHHG
jgi:hypothetical protein